MATDAALFEASRAGNRQAFAGIVERYKSLICAVTYNATGDFALSEDLAQDTFIAAWHDLPALKDPQKLRPWLCSIARHRAARALEKRRRDVVMQARLLDSGSEARTAAPSPRDAAITKEEEALMWRSLERVPESYRLPLILYYREGQSVQQVAQTLALSTDAVKQRLSRGRRMLKDEVAGLVEHSLERTRPAKDFTLGVLCALPRITTFSAAGSGAQSAGAAAHPAGTSCLWRSLLGAKQLAATGAIVTIAVGLCAAYFLHANGSSQSSPVVMAQENAHETEDLESAAQPGGAQEAGNASEGRGTVAALDAGNTVSAAQQTPGAPPGTRVIHFPKDRFLGTLSIGTGLCECEYRLARGCDRSDEWDYLGPAQGDVTVPSDVAVRLEVAAGALHDLSPLSALNPGDLHSLFISCPPGLLPNPEAAIMPHLADLTGLKCLGLRDLNLAANDCRFIKNLKELEELRIAGADSIAESGLAYLRGLKSLEALKLTTSGTIPDAVLARVSRLTSLRELMLGADDIAVAGLAHLSSLPSLRFLEFHGVRCRDGDQALRYLKDIPSLRYLSLVGPDLAFTDAGLIHLAQLSDLEELWFLDVHGIDDAALVHLLPFRSLKSLQLAGTQVTEQGLAHIAETKSLEKLHLPYFGMTDRGLAYVAELEELRWLSAGGGRPVDLTDPGPFTDRGLYHLSKLKKLETLSICSGSGITDTGLEFLARLPNLTWLSLMCNGITDNGLATLASMQSLRYLNISCPGKLTVSGVNHLDALVDLERLKVGRFVQDYSGLALSNLTKLKHLTLSFNGTLRDEDTACVADLKGLEWLSLGSGPTFSDAGMAHLKGLSALQLLSIGGDGLTDKALSYLADTRSLERLYIRGNGNITDRGLRHLESLDSLRMLELDTSNRLSRGAIERLYRELPSLRTFNRERVDIGMAAFAGPRTGPAPEGQ
ncbi:MAG TPA: sigma-70 family RNA polymerase sigma factor [Candidatus Hydrogenedentes bacterium]|nr:sigma-70 family RNA polymerase sigma factor [Candidatus Hydrogenedentota bacterium]